MATQAQFEANRRNAHQPPQSKIENPKSKIRCGLLARVVPAEAEGFQDLLLGLYESLRPQDELQRFLVDQVALCMIRLQRSAAWEAQTLARPAHISLPPGRQYEMEEPPQVPASVRVPAFVASEGGQALLRYENACNRQIKRNLELLLKLQATPRATQPPACPYLQETDDLEGAALSAPPSSRDDGQANAPQLGSPGLSAFQPGPSGPGEYTGNLPFTGFRFGHTPSPLQREGRMPAPETSGEGR